MASNFNSLERKKSFKRGKKATDYFSVGTKDDSELPTFFINCVNHLEEHALGEEGILRIHGRTQDTNAINAFLSGHTNEKRATSLGQVDPHAVATLLKNYLNQGPPLLPMEHYPTFVEIGGKKEADGENLLFLREVISSIPLTHQRVLHRVLIFIDNVRQHSDRNKMDGKALSIIFNPLLVRAPTEVSPAQILSQTQSCINCVLTLINNYKAIFDGIGLNYFETPASPQIANRDGTLREFSTASISKDKVKIRFEFNFVVKTGGCIQETVSVFLKYAKQGVKRETGQTRALVCTKPQEVVWDEVVPLEVTLGVNKRTKAFEPRNFIVTLKCATTKGSKTLGAAIINLAELSPPTLQLSPREELKTYEMLHKGGKSKNLLLQVRSFSEWRKINNKLVVRQEESTNTVSRRYTVLASQLTEDGQRADDPPSRFVTLRGRAALLSMPNLNNFDAHRNDKQEDERYPLSARDQYTKSESSILTPTKAPENPFSTSPTSSASSSPTSATAPTTYSYVPATTPPLLDNVPPPDFSTAASIPVPTSDAGDQPSSVNELQTTINSEGVTENSSLTTDSTPNPSTNSNNTNDAPITIEPKVEISGNAVGEEHSNDKTQEAPVQAINQQDTESEPASKVDVEPPVVSPRRPASRKSSPRKTPREESTTEQPSRKEAESKKEVETEINNEAEHRSEHKKEVEHKKESGRRRDSEHRKESERKRDRTKDEKNAEKEKEGHHRTRERSHSHGSKSDSKRKSERHEKRKSIEAEAKKEQAQQKENTQEKENVQVKEKTQLKETTHEKEKERDGFSSDAAHQINGAVSSHGQDSDTTTTTSPEISVTPVKREKRLTISELSIPLESPSRVVSPTLDPDESDMESDNDFDGVHPGFTQQMFELVEQIELLQQQRRQLELETFNLRKCLVHNEIYRPQTLDFSERGLSSTAEQIIENLFRMNCFLEPHNFLPSFFDSIIISLQQESKNEVEAPKILYWLSTTLEHTGSYCFGSYRINSAYSK